MPAWALSAAFVSVTRTRSELSIVCHESALPASLEAKRGFRCLRGRGPLDFAAIGILASLTHALAAAGISIFALSTHDTDYILVAAESLDRAVRALAAAGYVVHT